MGFFTPTSTAEADLRAAVSAAQSAGGGTVLLESADYLIGSSIVLPSKVSLLGLGKARLVASAACNLISFQSSVGAAKSLLAPVAKFATSATLNDATGFVTGQCAQFFRQPATGGNYQIIPVEILDVQGNTIEFTPPLPFAIAPGDIHNVTPFNPARDITIDNVSFCGAGLGGITRGILAQNTYDCRFMRLRFDDFTGAAGAYMYSGIGTVFDDITLRNCGSPSESDLMIWGQCQASGGRIRSRAASGFGPQIQWGAYHNLSQISCFKSKGRGIKFAGVYHGRFSQLEAHDVAYTGIAISLGTSFCQMDGLTACHQRNPNNLYNDVGVWFSDQQNTNNILTNVVALDNLTSDISVYPSDTGNVIRPASYGSLYNGGGAVVSAS